MAYWWFALQEASIDFLDHTCIKIHEEVGYTKLAPYVEL